MLEDILEESKNSEDDQLQVQLTKVERYIYELSHGIITEQLCRSYIQDVRDAIQIGVLYEEIIDIDLAEMSLNELNKLLIAGVTSAVKEAYYG